MFFIEGLRVSHLILPKEKSSQIVSTWALPMRFFKLLGNLWLARNVLKLKHSFYWILNKFRNSRRCRQCLCLAHKCCLSNSRRITKEMLQRVEQSHGVSNRWVVAWSFVAQSLFESLCPLQSFANLRDCFTIARFLRTLWWVTQQFEATHNVVKVRFKDCVRCVWFFENLMDCQCHHSNIQKTAKEGLRRIEGLHFPASPWNIAWALVILQFVERLRALWSSNSSWDVAIIARA